MANRRQTGGQRRNEETALSGEQDPIERTLAAVRTLLNEVLDPTGDGDPRVDLDTSFDVDLELESLEFVALAERLRTYFGAQIDFVEWLATLELDEIIALTVGDVVAFVAATLTRTSPLPASA